jgi:L-seryl-tRNA(Ser) seleniumtransferase
MSEPGERQRQAPPADHRGATIFAALGVRPVINAAGTATRLSGGLMHPAVTAAMAEAAAACVEMPDLQAAASREIARATGAAAGIVTAGSSAALLLAAAACMAQRDVAAMDRLPDAAPRDEFIVMRSQRNMYDRAIRVAGGRLVEVGIPDRFSGAGVRDADAAEVAAAIGPRSAAICWLAQPWSEPPLAEVVAVAHAAGLPVIVDAAAQLPPQSNLTAFIAAGADLVCFSGGKAIGGPQASGILAGRRDLVASALLQMLDLDLPAAQFRLPAEFAGNTRLAALPRHGIGRSCKVGKEEIVGLLVALRRFVAEGDTARMARLTASLEAVRDAAGALPGLEIAAGPLPLLLVRLADRAAAQAAEARLRARRPAIHVGQARLREGVLVVNPLALAERDLAPLGLALREACGDQPPATPCTLT